MQCIYNGQYIFRGSENENINVLWKGKVNANFSVTSGLQNSFYILVF